MTTEPRRARAIAVECVVAPAADDENCTTADLVDPPHDTREARSKRTAGVVIRPSFEGNPRCSTLAYQWTPAEKKPAACVRHDEHEDMSAAAAAAVEVSQVPTDCSETALLDISDVPPPDDDEKTDDHVASAAGSSHVDEEEGANIDALTRIGQDIKEAIVCVASSAAVDWSRAHEPRRHMRNPPQGTAVRVASQLKMDGATSTRNPLNSKTRTREASSWHHLDDLVEQSILCDVPAEDLKPLGKPLRSEKATLLLEGYLSEADKRALRSTQLIGTASASSSSPNTARDSAGAATPIAAGRLEDADPLQHFLDAENTIERRRYIGEKWLDKITLVRSLSVFHKLFQKRYREKQSEGVMTDAVRFGLRRWWKRTEQRVRVQRHQPFPRPPPAKLLKMQCAFMADWPLECVEELLSKGDPMVFVPGESVFHEDDPTQDIYIVCSGEFQAVIMCGPRAHRRCFAGAYDRAGGASESPVTDRWKAKERPGSKSCQATKVVAHHLDGSIFGMDGLLVGIKEPRCYTAWCTGTKPSFVLRVRRADVFQAMSTKVADITREVIQNLAWRQRHQYRYGAAFPIPVDVLRRASATFEHWHVHALQQLMATASIHVYKKGDIVCLQGDTAPVGAAQLAFVLKGSLEQLDIGFPSAPRVLPPFSVFGEEEVVLCGYPNRSTIKSLETTDVLIILQEDYLAVSRTNGECGEFARTAITKGIASRLIKSSNCPEALLEDPLMCFLFPEPLIHRLWHELAEPVFILQGDGVLRTWDEASHMYLFQTGTLFQQYGADGPQVPVVSLGDLLHGAVRDDAVQHIQTDMEAEDDIYNAINSPGAYMKGKRAQQSQSQSAAVPSSLGGGGSSGGLHVWVPLERNLIPGDSPTGGVVIGLVEFAHGRTYSLSHVRATSNVVAWRWSRKRLEMMLQQYHPQVWTAIQLPETRNVVRRHFLAMSLKNLKDEAAPRSAEQLNQQIDRTTS